MQSVSWQIEIARLAGGIQVRQGESDSVQLVGGYLAGVVSLIEPPQPSMAKRTDHELIILCAGTAINEFANLPHTDTDTWRLPTGALNGYARNMALSERQIFHSLSRMPFVDSAELALILGEPHSTVHRTLVGLLVEGVARRVSHGTDHLPSSQRYYLTTQGIREATEVLGFDTPSDFVRAYPMSREWLTLLIRRMDAVASIYRLAASLSPGIDGLRSRVEFHRRGRFDATTTLHDGRSFGVVRQGLALRRRSLYDRLRAIAQYGHGRRPGTVLILVPSAWELRRTARFCINNDLRDCYVAVESRDALEIRDLRLWCEPTGLFGLTYYTLETVIAHGKRSGGPRTQSPERKRASLQHKKSGSQTWAESRRIVGPGGPEGHGRLRGAEQLPVRGAVADCGDRRQHGAHRGVGTGPGGGSESWEWTTQADQEDPVAGSAVEPIVGAWGKRAEICRSNWSSSESGGADVCPGPKERVWGQHPGAWRGRRGALDSPADGGGLPQAWNTCTMGHPSWRQVTPNGRRLG